MPSCFIFLRLVMKTKRIYLFILTMKINLESVWKLNMQKQTILVKWPAYLSINFQDEHWGHSGFPSDSKKDRKVDPMLATTKLPHGNPKWQTNRPLLCKISTSASLNAGRCRWNRGMGLYICMYIYKIFDLKKRSFGRPKIKVYHKHVQQETPFQHMWLNLKDYFLYCLKASHWCPPIQPEDPCHIASIWIALHSPSKFPRHPIPRTFIYRG